MTTTDAAPIIAPGPFQQTITLGDVRAATLKYLETSVTSTVTPVVPDVPVALSPQEQGTFTVEVRNAGEPNGVRMIDVRHHLTAEPAGAVLFVPPQGPAFARATNDASAPILPANPPVPEMFVFPANSTLEVGDFDNVVGLRVKAVSLGEVTIHSHVHAAPDQDYLFPRESNAGNDNNVSVTVEVV